MPPRISWAFTNRNLSLLLNLGDACKFFARSSTRDSAIVRYGARFISLPEDFLRWAVNDVSLWNYFAPCPYGCFPAPKESCVILSPPLRTESLGANADFSQASAGWLQSMIVGKGSFFSMMEFMSSREEPLQGGLLNLLASGPPDLSSDHWAGRRFNDDLGYASGKRALCVHCSEK